MKKLGWGFWFLCLLVAAWNINTYRLGVEGRSSVYKWTYEDSPDGRYTLAYGDSPGYWVWVQLRRKGDTEVLADRWFNSQQPYEAIWLANYVRYSPYDAHRPIDLPPMWLEKWFAMLP